MSCVWDVFSTTISRSTLILQAVCSLYLSQMTGRQQRAGTEVRSCKYVIVPGGMVLVALTNLITTNQRGEVGYHA